MFDFIRKPDLWSALDAGLLDQIGQHSDFHLKTIQDLMVYSALKNMQGLNIAEIGGGDSRILKALRSTNSCYNIEKFEGADGGPSKEIAIDGVNRAGFAGGHFL